MTRDQTESEIRNAGVFVATEFEGLDIDPLPVLQNLLKLHNRLLAPFSTHLEKQYKISVKEFRALMMIGQLGETASHEIADLTGVNTMGISRAVGALRRQGRVEVQEDPANRRRKILRLTPEGQQLYEQMLPATEKVAHYLFKTLRPHEILSFNYFVTTLTASLEACDEEGRSAFLEETRPESESDGNTP